MTCEQLDLLVRNEEKEQADAKVLTRHLYLACDWRTRNQISEALDWKCHARIRHAAEAAEGDVIFGQRGMRHIRHSTPEEVLACINTLKSQVEALSRRVCNTQKKYHSYGKGPL
ncbi:MAG TPA: hypothetical protein PLT37_01520 [Kiritimatiellia bacterium]|mgnify:CR=1 FL=1|jgi:hypothetical protein|nr:hypothetical protein [Kiritimatiellia bacterium]MBP9571476.1 hypothetical protein [Kiritimatiellia bacterium]HQF19905.1 hypothetical protein [Kiritimatiellia bacterium]HQG73807.1 hypothetical protein [Kiritimatiellia bacterium]HXK78561.1 hypothetical protein [Kiritimatiellia bacterium]